MRKFHIPTFALSMTAVLALAQSFSAFAADNNPNDQTQPKKAGAAQPAKGPAQAVRQAAHVAPVVHAPSAPARVAQARQPAAKADVNTAARRTAVTRGNASPARTNAIGNQTPAAQIQNARSGRGNTTNSRSQIVAGATGGNSGGQYTRANNYGGRWTSGNNHTDWNQGQEHDWDGHHYRWYDGGWLIIDGGFWPVHVYQASGSMMTDAQQQLSNDGYYSGPIDGIPGPGTRRAIANYQTDNSLPVTGHLNIPTQQSLGLD